jgi:hypothetical protein
MRIGRYLLSTKEQGMIYRPDCLKGIEVYIDADFAGEWDPDDPMNTESIYSRTGYVICYAGCPVYWRSKLQTEVALSTAEAEYMALLQALRATLLTLNLMKEINIIFPLYLPSPRFIIKVSTLITATSGPVVAVGPRGTRCN